MILTTPPLVFQWIGTLAIGPPITSKSLSLDDQKTRTSETGWLGSSFVSSRPDRSYSKSTPAPLPVNSAESNRASIGVVLVSAIVPEYVPSVEPPATAKSQLPSNVNGWTVVSIGRSMKKGMLGS